MDRMHRQSDKTEPLLQMFGNFLATALGVLNATRKEGHRMSNKTGFLLGTSDSLNFSPPNIN